MILFCFLMLIEILCLYWGIRFLYIIYKLFTDEHYRECPPFVPSMHNERKMLIAKTSEILEKSTDHLTILDPGCGVGSLIIPLAKKFPQHKFVGIEWSKSLSLIAKIRTKKIANLTIINQDMFNHNFGEYDVIVCFLVSSLMEKFGKKVKNDHQSKKQTIISNSFAINNLPLSEEIKTDGKIFKNIYIYDI